MNKKRHQNDVIASPSPHHHLTITSGPRQELEVGPPKGYKFSANNDLQIKRIDSTSTTSNTKPELLRTKEAYCALEGLTIEASLTKETSNDNHFVIVSTKPTTSFSLYDYDPFKVSFFWNGETKQISGDKDQIDC